MGLFLTLLLSLLTGPRVLTDADLAPMPLGPKGDLARELMSRGKFGPAADAITATTPEARFLRGVLLEAANRHLEAVGVLEGVPEALPLLAGHARTVRAEALLAMKRYAEAAAEAAVVPLDDAYGKQARRVRARALRDAGDLKGAAALYEAMTKSSSRHDRANGLLGLARVRQAQGDTKAAIELLRALDVKHPADWTGAVARKEAAALLKAEKKLRPLWEKRSREEQLTRGERLNDRHRNEAAVEALKPLSKDRKLDRAQQCRQRYALGRALRKLRRWEEAQPVLEQAVKVCDRAKHELAPRARYLAGQAAERLGHEDKAAKHYATQMKKYGDHRLADDAGYYMVLHHLQDDEDLKKAKALATRLVKQFPEGDMVPEALFKVAVQAMRDGEPKVARAMLSLDAKLPPRDHIHHDGGRTEYWLARLDHQAGDLKKATARYRSVLASHPLSWYALMAYSRLHEVDAEAAAAAATAALTAEGFGPSLPAADAKTWQMTLPADVGGEAWERARLYARLGMAKDARRALRAAGAKGDRGDLLWLAAWVLDRAGAHLYSHDILRRKLFTYRHFAPANGTLKHWNVAFPTPFGRLIEQAAKDSGIPPYFIWGIIREESGFNAGIESFANAVGLMQLIVPTAKRMATDDDGTIDRNTLTDADLNVKLGARYLAHVQNHADAVLPLLPAGYNAGHGALKRWLNDRGDLPLDLFVETIPFEEARGYTKRVSSSWATYWHLYGRGKEDPPLPYIGQDTRHSVVVAKAKKAAEEAKKAAEVAAEVEVDEDAPPPGG